MSNISWFIQSILKTVDPFELDHKKYLELASGGTETLYRDWLRKCRTAVEFVNEDLEYTGGDAEVSIFIEELESLMKEDYNEIASIPHDKLF